MNLSRFLLFLMSIKDVGPTDIRKLINDGCIEKIQFENIEEVVTWLKKHRDYIRRKSSIDSLTMNDIDLANKKRKSIENALKNIGASYISYFDEDYPHRFKQMEDYPIILYYKGDISLMNSEKICTIIGTRNPNQIALEKGIKIAELKATEGYVVMSGLAEGCDTLGHRGCLNADGKTIAIVGTGLDSVYPKSNEGLEKEIVEKGGLIISEYQPGFRGASYSFVQRDRLQSAGADEVIVIQTKSNGGTMHASKASTEKYHKSLYVIDPVIIGDECDGNELLISEYNATIIRI